jgi:hypothetical protein
MKKLVTEVENEGLLKLMGQQVTLMCACYFYTGKLIGVNETCVLLEDPAIIYETGPWDIKKWTDCQSLNVKEWYVMIAMIESFGVAKQ